MLNVPIPVPAPAAAGPPSHPDPECHLQQDGGDSWPQWCEQACVPGNTRDDYRNRSVATLARVGMRVAAEVREEGRPGAPYPGRGVPGLDLEATKPGAAAGEGWQFPPRVLAVGTRNSEGSGHECQYETLSLLTAVECLLLLDRWNVPEWLQEAVVVEAPDPLEGGELHVFQPSPGTAAVDHLRLEEPDDRFGQLRPAHCRTSRPGSPRRAQCLPRRGARCSGSRGTAPHDRCGAPAGPAAPPPARRWPAPAHRGPVRSSASWRLASPRPGARRRR